MKRLKMLFGLAIAAMLAACAGPGEVKRIPVSMPDGERATIVAHDQQVPNWALATNKLALNYIVKGDVSAKQLAAIAETERACRIYTQTARPNELVAVAVSGVLYAITGGIGLALAANAFPAAQSHEYMRYGAAAGLLSGTANGIVSLGGKVYTFESCGSEIFYLFPQYAVRVIKK